MQPGNWLQDLNVGLDRYVSCRHLQAAARGDLQALQAAWEQAGHSWHAHVWGAGAQDFMGQTWTESLCSTAAAGGHLALLQWLHQNGCSWNRYTVLRRSQMGPPGSPAVGATQWLQMEWRYLRRGS